MTSKLKLKQIGLVLEFLERLGAFKAPPQHSASGGWRNTPAAVGLRSNYSSIDASRQEKHDAGKMNVDLLI